MYVYVLTPVDCPKMMVTVEEFMFRLKEFDFYSVTEDQINQEVTEAEKLFLKAGWEGDGVLRIMWIPPFIKGGTGDSWGDFAYFAKQNNNGTCYVCTHYPMPIDKACDLS